MQAADAVRQPFVTGRPQGCPGQGTMPGSPGSRPLAAFGTETASGYPRHFLNPTHPVQESIDGQDRRRRDEDGEGQ